MPSPQLVRRLAARINGRHSDHASSIDEADAGFALTEVLVSMIIFAIVSTAAVFGITAGIKSASVTQTRVVTANVAQQAIQQAVIAPRPSLTATPTATSTTTVGAGSYRVTRTIRYAPAAATACPTSLVVGTPYAIVVHVSAVPVAGSSRSVEMETVIAC